MLQPQNNSQQVEEKFLALKKQTLDTIHMACQTLEQCKSQNELQIVQQSQQQLEQASQLMNQMQGIAVTEATPAVQQQCEQVRLQIEQAAQTLQLIQTLNSGNNSFKK